MQESKSALETVNSSLGEASTQQSVAYQYLKTSPWTAFVALHIPVLLLDGNELQENTEPGSHLFP